MLRHRCQPYPRRRRDTQWGRVMFGDVIAIKTDAIVGLQQPKPIGVKAIERDRPAVHMIKHSKLHATLHAPSVPHGDGTVESWNAQCRGSEAICCNAAPSRIVTVLRSIAMEPSRRRC